MIRTKVQIVEIVDEKEKKKTMNFITVKIITRRKENRKS